MRISLTYAGSAPITASAVSVRPEPTSPAKPRISPSRSMKLIDRAVLERSAASSTSSTIFASARSGGFGGKLFSMRRPTIISTSRPTSVRATSVIADVLAIAQHGDAVAHFEDLFEVVRDEDHRDALRLQLAHDREQMLGFGGRERGGRLVEDQNARIERERLADLDELLLRDRQFADRHGQIDRHAAAARKIAAAARRILPPFEQAQAALQLAARGTCSPPRSDTESG